MGKNIKYKFGRTLREKIDSKHDREKLKDKLGSSAFLIPGEKKFPIVNPNTGKVSCKMIRAAKTRAAQFGYSDVYRKASVLFNQKCMSKRMLEKKSRLTEDMSTDDVIRATGDVAGTAVGAISNIARSKPKTTKDIVLKGATGAFFGMEAGDGLGDMAAWINGKMKKGKENGKLQKKQ